jgi:hypothetical protein
VPNHIFQFRHIPFRKKTAVIRQFLHYRRFLHFDRIINDVRFIGVGMLVPNHKHLLNLPSIMGQVGLKVHRNLHADRGNNQNQEVNLGCLR